MKQPFFLALVVATFSLYASAETPAPKPNIVLIMADDLGYHDIGCFGSKNNPTPHLDALAKQGMKFTDYHSNGAVCSPTRAALMTGRYQQRAGISGVITAASHRDIGMAIEETTIADTLSKNGYTTAIFGKWHLGYDPQFNPIHQGFGEFIGFVSGNVDYFAHIDQKGYKDWWKNDQLKPEEGYSTHLITQHSLQFIEQNKDKPFLLYLPYPTVHTPYQGPNDQAIRSKENTQANKGAKPIEQTYASMIEEMDKGIGEIMAALDKHKLTERTLLVFCSDNGANSNGNNGSLRGFKGSIYEGGHRVPMIARWPSVIAAGKTCDATVLSMDLFPTLLNIAGIKPPENLDGVSILPALRAESELKERTVFWSVGTGTAARRGPWKFIVEPGAENKSGTLYHLGNDPSEKTPVSNPEVQQQLKTELDAWRKSWADVKQHS